MILQSDRIEKTEKIQTELRKREWMTLYWYMRKNLMKSEKFHFKILQFRMQKVENKPILQYKM